MPDRPPFRAAAWLLLMASCRPVGAQDAGPVSGTVVDYLSKTPLPGRLVAVGDRRAVTDGRGAFVLAGAPAVYDLTIGEPDGRAASVYLGLTRRDPQLVHWLPAKRREWSDRAATVAGTLAGQFPLPQDAWINVRVLSPHAYQSSQVGGPGYGPLDVRWDGPDEIAGRLIALRHHDPASLLVRRPAAAAALGPEGDRGPAAAPGAGGPYRPRDCLARRLHPPRGRRVRSPGRR